MDKVKSSIPGIDEAISIGLILQIIEKMNFSTVVFDTAPTGHTLRMLSFPAILEQGIQQLSRLTSGEAGGLAGTFLNNPLLQNLGGIPNMIEMLKTFQASIEAIKKQFSDKTHTTFIAVCIPEFLSMYETERLKQELDKLEIDCHNIVINQVIFPNRECQCDMCNSRFEMQKKYINQIKEIYKDDDLGFGAPNEGPKDEIIISILPFMENEIRGVNELKESFHSFENNFKYFTCKIPTYFISVNCSYIKFILSIKNTLAIKTRAAGIPECTSTILPSFKNYNPRREK